jgi:multidrug efflux pump subunit AcrA (membrane-fusion protein)
MNDDTGGDGSPGGGSNDTGSRRGRRPRSGVVTGIDLLLAGRGGASAPVGPAAAGAAAHQKAPRRRNPLRSTRKLLSRPRVAVPVVVIVVAGASLGAWVVTRSAASAAPQYSIVPAVRTTLTQALSSTGTIEPKKTATLSFSAPGQVTAVEATAGQHVTEGQSLAAMDSPTLKAQAAQAQAGLAAAQSRLSQDQARSASSAQLAADQASVNAAQSQVDSANTALSGATLTSPISGIVTTVGFTIGQQLSGGGGGSSGGGSGGSGGGSGGSGGAGTGSGSSTQSITVVSTNDVINANVGATVVGHIKTGDQTQITTEGAAGPVSGTVASIGLIASTSSGVATFPVVINVTGTPAGLYAGASATISIIYRQLPDVLVVPAAAVQPAAGGKTVVYTMTGGRQVARDVTTGLTSGGLTQITSGLTAGAPVVVQIQRAVITGGSGSGNGGLLGPGSGVKRIQGGPGGNFVPAGGPGG